MAQREPGLLWREEKIRRKQMGFRVYHEDERGNKIYTDGGMDHDPISTIIGCVAVIIMLIAVCAALVLPIAVR
jgi:hypothetical protein